MIPFLLLLRLVPTYGAIDGGASVLLSNADGQNPYASVVRYVGRVQCTGVFIATAEDAGDGGGPAYVLTNGHCADFPGANDVIVDRPAPATHRVIFNYFADTTDRQTSVPVSRIAYATMQGRDIAVLELGARYADVVAWGFTPWQLTATTPDPDEPVVVVGAPLTASPAASFLRLASCQLEGRARVVLEYIWHWFDADRNRCTDIRGGSSGSPVISRRTARVVGLLNTTTIGAVRYTECALDHPCEPVAGGEDGRLATSYMSPLDAVARCFDDEGLFDAARPACPLDAGRQIRATPAFLGLVNPALSAPLLGSPRLRWNVSVSGPFDRYAYKVVNAADQDCRDSRGYGSARFVSDAPLIDDELPRMEGHYFLCILGASIAGRDVVRQDVRHPTVVAVRIDSTPPEVPARITIAESETGWNVSFATLDPEISAYALKFGRPGETQCSAPDGYRPLLLPFIFLSKASRPYTFCAVPYDGALNPGPVFEALLP